ncbi:MAG: DUF2007 domain-containing protein [Ignavibacteria bacterium]|nr:DUF2007 domain-containing protein [Ignavibacteria bacterium]MBP7093256.1 DUF2007 domain-containing protein [Candidatus Kapabacteria bacterium]MBK6419980.1 DUF2007 domain-containing protein [Ignavibacteria bacterium]MBK6759387.1 DUF2007 domain-containing protein [Ignavibacteria bacterium]MBK7034160.1 DUF2007 domain-containing protein [Ignavibacteria bacterium]
MILLSTFENEMEAQLLASQLREAGIDHKIEENKADGFQLFVFEDDVEEAKEILEARASSDDDYLVDLGGDDLDLDEFADE